MKPIHAIRSGRLNLGLKSSFIVLILLAITVQPRVSLGQAEKGMDSLSSLLISDAAIPDLVALSKMDGLFASKKTFGPLQTIKKFSLECRLRLATSSSTELHKRRDHKESELKAMQNEFEKRMTDAQSKSNSIPISRAAAEQLLIAAQLELQKVSWDLASEKAFFESVDSEKENSAEAKKLAMELQVTGLEAKGLEEELQAVEKDLDIAEVHLNNGRANISEVDKIRLSVGRARNALAIQQLKRQAVEAREIALENSRSAESKMQIRKLSARKEHIEHYVKELFDALPTINRSELMRARMIRLEESVAKLSGLLDEQEIKSNEIQSLLSTLQSIEFIEQKE
jgi:hypothetical protein